MENSLQRDRINAVMNHVIACPDRGHTLSELASIAHYSEFPNFRQSDASERSSRSNTRLDKV